MATPPPPLPTSAVAEEADHQGSESPEPDYHVFQPVLRTFTPLEAQDDPALVVILADEGTLGQVLVIPSNPIPTRSGGPNPSTSAVTDWFGTLVAHHPRSLRTEIRAGDHGQPATSCQRAPVPPVEGGRSRWAAVQDGTRNCLGSRPPPARSLGWPPAEEPQGAL